MGFGVSPMLAVVLLKVRAHVFPCSLTVATTLGARVRWNTWHR